MAGETYLTVSGNLTAPPKTGISSRGIPWTRMRVASSARLYDRQTAEWRDGDTLFLDVSCWRSLAENAAATLERGDRVLVSGRLKQRTYEDQQGVRHTVSEIEADAIGPDLGRAPAQLMRGKAAPQQEPGEAAQPEAEIQSRQPEADTAVEQSPVAVGT